MPVRLVIVLVVCALSLTAVPTAFAADPAVQVLYVDTSAATASDTNAGTSTSPLRTISRAVALADSANAKGTATTIRVAPGVYRERVHLAAGTTSAALTLEATGPGVVVSGADRWTQWTKTGEGVWTAPWTYKWGFSAVPAGWPTVEPLLRRREIVVVNGAIMRQVLEPTDLSSYNGAFYVDETAGTLQVRPPAGVDLPTAAVDVATRHHTLTTHLRNNVTIRGISFQHAATDVQRGGVLVNGGTDILVEDARFEHNNWAGLQMFSVTGATLRRSVFSGNGVMGLTAWRVRDLLVEDSHNSHNNLWRGLWANYSNWEDGLKIAASRRVTFRRHTSVGNRGNGLWFDGDVAHVTVEDSFLADNARYGIFTEISQGPFLIHNNRICGNGIVGVMNVKSRDVTIAGNEIFNQGAEAIGLSGAVGAVTITDFETQTPISLRNEDFTLRDNILSQGSKRLLRNNLQADDWNYLKATFTASGNRWHSTHSGPFTLPGVWVDFSKWRTDTGQDSTSSFAAPATPLTCQTQIVEPAPDPVTDTTDTSTTDTSTTDTSTTDTSTETTDPITDETRIGKPLTIKKKSKD